MHKLRAYLSTLDTIPGIGWVGGKGRERKMGRGEKGERRGKGEGKKGEKREKKGEAGRRESTPSGTSSALILDLSSESQTSWLLRCSSSAFAFLLLPTFPSLFG